MAIGGQSNLWHLKCSTKFRESAFKMTRDAFGMAYQNGFELTVRFLLSRGIRPQWALESAQSAWVKGWEMVGQLRDEKMVLSWVNSIALNDYRKWLRQQSKLQILSDLPGGTQPDISALDLKRILAFVSLDDRCLLEFRMQGASVSEIAAHYQVSGTAIRLRLLRARRMAKSKVENRTIRPIASKAA
jgi:DNA-directed RNA polymerase specialized sigma24 family protein